MKFIMPKLLLNIERWKWNDDFRVYVSNMGHFKNEYKKPLSVLIDKRKGYCKIKTSCGLKTAHRLVMLTWCPIPNAEDLTVDHLDHNKRNNALSNLEWVTEIENWERARRDEVNEELLKQVNNIVKDAVLTKVTNGTQIYASIADAVSDCYKISLPKKQRNNATLSKSQSTRMQNRLKKAIENQTEYYGKKWNYV